MSTTTMSPKSLVSIIMPTWNRAELIGESIQSVLDQSYSHWELIIIDDGSTDKTREIVSAFKDSRIHYQYHQHSGLITSIRTTGLTAVRGEFIAFHDSDDVWFNDKLAVQLDHLRKHPDVEYIITNGFHFGDEVEDPASLESFFKGNLFLPMLLEERFIYFVPSLLFRKEALSKIQSSSTTDLAFFLSLASMSQGIFTNERLVRIRKHVGSDSHVNPEKAFRDFLQMVDVLLANQKITTSQHRHLKIREWYKLSLLHIQAHSWVSALDALKQVTAINPLHLKSRIRQGQVLWKSMKVSPQSKITSSVSR